MDVNIDGPGNLLNLSLQPLCNLKVPLFVTSDDLDIDRCRKSEVQNLFGDVRRFEEEVNRGEPLVQTLAKLPRVLKCRSVLLGKRDKDIAVARANGRAVSE